MQAFRRLLPIRYLQFIRPSLQFSGKSPKQQFEQALADLKKKAK